ncbi:thiamine phosphate synthase, partial [Mycobacterium tuberculosis]|nr:thiamine phosphate synthase [Mycobacterium tuberculosis]
GLDDALRALKPGGIVGAGGLKTRHAAMEAGERDVDYVFFGLTERAEDDDVHPRTLELAAWWVPLFEAPCVMLAGGSLASVAEAA